MMRLPFSYYGGKQTLAKRIIEMIPAHTLYAEPFTGGAAVFFNKEKSDIEVLNDTNKNLMTFYRVVQNDFTSLEKEVRISLHSRSLHKDASTIYNAPHLFNETKVAWSVWALGNMSFASMMDGSFGYDKTKQHTTKKITNKRNTFTEDYAIRLQNVNLECTDAIRIIESRDTPNSFFFVDPPYYNSDCGHYDGYTIDDFENLLKALSKIQGKFILSSYPSPILKQYTQSNSWNTQTFDFKVSVANNSKKPRKEKTEVLTYNYDFKPKGK